MARIDDPWNDFVDRAIEHAPQRAEEEDLYALFYYQAEVNNGGHHQYFHNWPDPDVWKRAVAGARAIGQDAVADSLESAAEMWLGKKRRRPFTIRGFMRQAREKEFEAFDQAFYTAEAAFQAAFEAAFRPSEEN